MQQYVIIVNVMGKGCAVDASEILANAVIHKTWDVRQTAWVMVVRTGDEPCITTWDGTGERVRKVA